MDKATTLAGPLGRVLLCFIFLLAGYGKATAPQGTIEYIASHGLPLPQIAYAVALAVELGCGLLVLVGYQARLAALVLAGFCIVTGIVFHYQPGDQAQMINFMKNLAMAGGFLQIVAHGAGALSVDNRKA
ncbi:MAG: DoxX family protein [Parvibaculum sp.]|uniref:DoxX family protein n=1 Tax=Parvibaculum sp. TaxID=2024848 RepID=UPI0028437699|nr:DoxX family protein [Parvibaculum sp.]MDR3500859.1 DoxX family protein [Parvibaculum sp.]